MLFAPIVTTVVLQWLAGAKLSLRRSVQLSGRGVLTLLALNVLNVLLSFVPLLGRLVSLVLAWIGFVAVPAAIAERLNPFAAIERSSLLSTRPLWPTLAALLACGIMLAIPIATAEVLREIWYVPPTPGPDMYRGFEWAQQLRPIALILVATNCVLLPFQGIVRAVCYALLQRDRTGAQNEVAQVFE